MSILFELLRELSNGGSFCPVGDGCRTMPFHQACNFDVDTSPPQRLAVVGKSLDDISVHVYHWNNTESTNVDILADAVTLIAVTRTIEGNPSGAESFS